MIKFTIYYKCTAHNYNVIKLIMNGYPTSISGVVSELFIPLVYHMH